MACSFTTGDRKSPAAGSSLSKIARKGLSIEKAGKSRQRSKKVMKLKPQISVKGTHAFLTRVATLGETDPDAAYKLWWEEGQLWDPWAKRALTDQKRKENFVQVLRLCAEFNIGKPASKRMGPTVHGVIEFERLMPAPGSKA